MTELPQRFAGIRMSKRLPALEWVAVALGALTFVWGFLDWYGTSDGGQNGYRLLDGYLPVGFALLAGLFAVVNLRADRTERTAWLAIGTSLFAVAFTIVAVTVKPTLILLLEGFSGLGRHGRGPPLDPDRPDPDVGYHDLAVALPGTRLVVRQRTGRDVRSIQPARPADTGRPAVVRAPARPAIVRPTARSALLRRGAVRSALVRRETPSWSQSFGPPGPAGHAEWRPDDSPQRPGPPDPLALHLAPTNRAEGVLSRHPCR